LTDSSLKIGGTPDSPNESPSSSHAQPPAVLHAGEFFSRARERLNFDVPPGLSDASIIAPSGDFGTDQMLQIIAREKPIRQAAVLIGVVERDLPTVLLTTRANHLIDHPGQVSFPGGKIDPDDRSPLDAALREADEEIGLKRDFVEPLGYLDVYATSFGFRVLPTLAKVRPGFELAINATEVEDAFEVPLAFLMDPLNHKQGTKEFRGIKRYFYEMPYEQRYIWGATAGMLRVLYQRIYAS
jgi:8-oxo-dGTP pyrophosphatase MutT (NUDIX family)